MDEMAAMDDAAEMIIPLLRMSELISEHSRRVSLLAVLIGRVLDLSHEELHELKLGGLLHDIGKMSISQGILKKPGKLTHDEFAVVKTHPVLGGNFVEAICYPQQIVDMVRYHHERLDGSGYPFGLAGDELPLASRIIAVADVYEAMTAVRPYRPALSVCEAFAELSQANRYDQAVVQALKRALSSVNLTDLCELAREFGTPDVKTAL
ncbi:MAG: HD-GYP domain-containing protein [Firmicutes bacterium]|nr:HD-GYP domain-containing protein [Bacillota bacterium]